MHLLDNVIAAMFLSFFIGFIADLAIRRLPVYRWMSTRFLFANPATYEAIGVLWYRKLLLATPLRSFNPNIRFTKSRDLDSLKNVRTIMAAAEVSHWLGFMAMLAMTVVAWWFRGPVIGMIYVLFNILGNVYPCLLQQYNKSRLYPLIDALERRARS